MCLHTLCAICLLVAIYWYKRSGFTATLHVFTLCFAVYMGSCCYQQIIFTTSASSVTKLLRTTSRMPMPSSVTRHSSQLEPTSIPTPSPKLEPTSVYGDRENDSPSVCTCSEAIVAVSAVSLLLILTLSTVVLTQCLLMVRMRRYRNKRETYVEATSPTTKTTHVPVSPNEAYALTKITSPWEEVTYEIVQ